MLVLSLSRCLLIIKPIHLTNMRASLYNFSLTVHRYYSFVFFSIRSYSVCCAMPFCCIMPIFFFLLFVHLILLFCLISFFFVVVLVLLSQNYFFSAHRAPILRSVCVLHTRPDDSFAMDTHWFGIREYCDWTFVQFGVA